MRLAGRFVLLAFTLLQLLLAHSAFIRKASATLSCGRAMTLLRASVSDSAPSLTALKHLREASGAPMMDCKTALQDPGVAGDMNKAIAWLRAKGLAKVTASTRSTKEGLIAVHTSTDQRSVVLVEVNCETDFVKRNKDFQTFVGLLADTVLRSGGSDSRELTIAEVLAFRPPRDHVSVTGGEAKAFDSIEDALGDIAASIRETIVIRRASIVVPSSPGSVLAAYVHNKVGGLRSAQTQLGKIASVVVLNAEPALQPAAALSLQQDAGHKLAMHIAAAQPLFLDAAGAPDAFVQAESTIFREQLAAERKPTDVVDRIVAGKVAKRLAEVSLLQQSHQGESGGSSVERVLRDVGQRLGVDVTVAAFARWSLNE